MSAVNHATPVHDNFCRCRVCKPPLVSERSDGLLRLRIGTAGIAVAAITLIAARASGVLS